MTAKYIERNLIVVDNLVPSLEAIQAAKEQGEAAIKTKIVRKFLQKHGWNDDSVMFVDAEKNEHLTLATRNFKREVRVMEQVAVNVYDLLKVHKLVISEKALRSLEARLLSETGKSICRREGKFQTVITEDQLFKWEENARKMREKARSRRELEMQEKAKAEVSL